MSSLKTRQVAVLLGTPSLVFIMLVEMLHKGTCPLSMAGTKQSNELALSRL